MIASVLRKAFGTRNTREFKRMERVVARTNALEEEMRARSDAGLTTASLRKRIVGRVLPIVSAD